MQFDMKKAFGDIDEFADKVLNFVLTIHDKSLNKKELFELQCKVVALCKAAGLIIGKMSETNSINNAKIACNTLLKQGIIDGIKLRNEIDKKNVS